MSAVDVDWIVHACDESSFQVYAGSGRKCPDCNFRAMNSHDFAAHRRVCDAKERRMGWRRNDDGSEWCSSEGDLQLKLACLQNGRVILNGWEITLSDNQKWLRRAPLKIQV